MIEILDQHAAVPTTGAVGPLPAEPRRADARDGDGRGARLHYAEYAKDPRMKLNLGIRRRLAPLLDNGRAEVELMHAILFSLPVRPFCTTATRSPWATMSTLATATGYGPHAVDGRPQRRLLAGRARAALPAAAMDPVYGYRRSTSRRSCARRRRSCAGCGASSSCASSIPCSASATCHVCGPANPSFRPHPLAPRRIVLCVHNLARSAQAVELDLSALQRADSGGALGRTESRASASSRTCSPSGRVGSSGSTWDPADEQLERTSTFAAGSRTATCTSWTGSSCSARSPRSTWFGGKSRDVLDAACSTPSSRPAEPPIIAFAVVEVRYGLEKPRPLPPAARGSADRDG